jgi:hypothetical protein
MDHIVWRYALCREQVIAIRGVMTEKGFRTKQRIPNTLRLFETKQQALQAQKKIIEKAIEFLQKKLENVNEEITKEESAEDTFPKEEESPISSGSTK